MFDFKEVVLPAETPEKTVEETLKAECIGGWQVDRKVAGYRGDPAFNLYILKKAKDQETLEEQIASQEESTGKSIPSAPQVPDSNQISTPEPPPIYRPAGNF